MGPSPILITCPRGAGPYLAREVEALGLEVLGGTEATASTRGDMADAMRLNLHLRTAHRVLLLLEEFEALTPDQLYVELTDIPWEDIVPRRGYLTVTSTVDTPSITNTAYANQRAKDAVVDRIRQRTGVRPDAGPRRDRTVIHLYWKGDRASVYLDTSGEPISRRGYRVEHGAAPMGEALAAAVIMATGWTGRGPFLNPMCGSGTLAIEAALVSAGTPPGLLRSNFGFMHLAGFDKKQWEGIRREALSRKTPRLPGYIVATDIDKTVLKAARRNASRAGVEGTIEFRACDFAETPVPEAGDGGVVVLNPEYGARTGEEEKLRPLYTRMGDFMKQRCQGYTGFIFTGNPRLSKAVGLRTSRREAFYNGPIECRLLRYDLYAGTRKG